MTSIKILSVFLVAGLLAGASALAQETASSAVEETAAEVRARESAASLTELLQAARQEATKVSRENRERLRRFETERNNQRALLRQAKADRDAAQRQADRLKALFDNNERKLEDLQDTFRIQSGNMGEMFGVVRQVAGDVKGIIDASMVSVQYPDRGKLADRLAQIKGLPSIEELNDLRVLMLNEMVESAKVVRFSTRIVNADGTFSNAEVVRVGVFNLITGDEFLTYEQKTKSVKVLPRQPKGRYRDMAENLFEATSGNVAMAVDPSFGSLLKLLINAPTFGERIEQGGTVGYVIIVLGIFGFLVSIERWLFLSGASTKVRRQLKSAEPNQDNALGRILAVYHQNKEIDTETLELKLDEAILKETPKFEKRQGTIKVLAAVAPLMGLLGTVVGMIETFQAITLFGTGNPKLMAGGISQALMTTVMGLVVAIPLVLMYSLVAAKSRGLVEILEEQSAGMIARHSEQETFK
ncbi:MAG: MotA/TolQ/ExbB proton channel family protein [Proteobacteria bacterium]|nr:MotA/TolQ/ExbB proton channel family protein [Pseudomonadota bacterium]